MACNVFGTPVNAETLKGIPEFADKEIITTKDMAQVAIDMKNAEGKDIQARAYVENMYKRYENIYCALGLIYNATGAPLTFFTFWNWWCFVAPAPFPAVIENGQWGAFLCVNKNRSNGDEGCGGAVVYRGSDEDGKEVDHFIGWDTQFLPAIPKACVDIGYVGQFPTSTRLVEKVGACGQHAMVVRFGLMSSAMIGSDKMAVLEVIIRHTPASFIF